jgi:D-beta-D-heptose 7-phosphate kinase/D-beta-D-heptose 1-phosphate adenosyltransferase
MTRCIVNGTFDILHLGHLKLLKAAKSLGVVCVAIDSDPRVRQFKGPQRPINNCFQRITMLKALRYVDYVVVFHSDNELRQIIREWQPDFMVKGSDYIGKPIVGEELVKEIIFIDITDDSTTKIIERISNR